MNNFSQTIDQATSDAFIPSFYEDLPVPDLSTTSSCGSVKECIFDSLISNVLDIGIETKIRIQNYMNKIKVIGMYSIPQF